MDVQHMAETKSDLQQTWRTLWHKHGKKGSVAGATGVGKTKPAIDEMMALWKSWQYQLTLVNHGALSGPSCPRIFLAVPTEKLRDEGWPEEIRKWYGDEGMEMWDTCVTACCYISMYKVRGEHYDLVVLDEAHNITLLSGEFFKNNIYTAVMGMTATAPDQQRDPEKYAILHKYAPVIFTYTLDQGVSDGVVNDFAINVILMPLDKITRNIKAGTKAKPFYTTEHNHYEYLSKLIKKLYIQLDIPGYSADDLEKMHERIKFKLLERTRFIYNLPSKTRLARKVMAQVIGDKRTLIFCGSIEQSRALCGDEVYNSKDSDNGKFEAFKAGEGLFLGVVNAANEGHNIVDLKQSIVVQMNSNERHAVQRMGRTVRVDGSDETSVMWVICAQGTVDESWVNKSLANFDSTKIRYLTSKEFE